MCRIAAWSGPSVALEDIVTKPSHSLLEQSHHATEAKLAVNGDGFGIAWYGDSAAPGLYRDVLPAWADGNLTSLCRMVRSHRFIAHIRASTVGETSRANCHPFTWDRWSFCHNGQIPQFPSIRRRLEAALPDELYMHRRGTTDSEVVFLTLLAQGLDQDPAEALRRTLATLGPVTAGPVRFTCVFSDGDTLYALRHASDAFAPTLYVSKTEPSAGKTLASEPLCADAANWQALEIDTLYAIASDGLVTSEPLWPAVSQTA